MLYFLTLAQDPARGIKRSPGLVKVIHKKDVERSATVEIVGEAEPASQGGILFFPGGEIL